jgi:hypothetical protein
LPTSHMYTVSTAWRSMSSRAELTIRLEVHYIGV